MTSLSQRAKKGAATSLLEYAGKGEEETLFIGSEDQSVAMESLPKT